MTNEDLATTLRKIAADLEAGGTTDAPAIIKRLEAIAVPNAHVGRGDEMDHTDAGYRLQMEWYAGQGLSMLQEGQYFGINSWLNCIDKFTTRRAP